MTNLDLVISLHGDFSLHETASEELKQGLVCIEFCILMQIMLISGKSKTCSIQVDCICVSIYEIKAIYGSTKRRNQKDAGDFWPIILALFHVFIPGKTCHHLEKFQKQLE